MTFTAENILFSGGMDTKRRDIEPVASQGLMLSTVGVLITTVVTGLLIYYLSEWTRLDIGLTLPMSMLLAATATQLLVNPQNLSELTTFATKFNNTDR